MMPLTKLRRPWRTFVSDIKYDYELDQIIYLYYADRLDITLELYLNVPPPMVNYGHYLLNIVPITLYSLKFWMGTNKQGYPVASQLQYIMRVMVANARTGKNYYLFVELISNRDERRAMFCDSNLGKWKGQYERFICQTHVNGYRSYAKDPLVFLTMIQASDEEREALREMMRADGILIPLSSYHRVYPAAEEKLLTLQQYFNRHYYFRYMMFDNLQWELTRDPAAFKTWLYGKEWSEYAHQKRIQHLQYCWCNDMPHWQPKLFMKPSFRLFFTRFDEMYDFRGFSMLSSSCTTYRVFSDFEEEYGEIFCCIDFLLYHIDTVYHVNQFGGLGEIRSLEPCARPIVNSYGELIARMVVKNYGSIYLEMIIITYRSPFELVSECILFLTRNLKLFIDIIQTGNKDDIYNFIVRNEGLLVSPNEFDNRLRTKCTRVITNHFLNVKTKWVWTAATLGEEMVSTLRIPESFQDQFMDELKWSLMIRSWQRAVEDLTKDIAECGQAEFVEKSQKLDKLIDEKIAVTEQQLQSQGWQEDDIYILKFASVRNDSIINFLDVDDVD